MLTSLVLSQNLPPFSLSSAPKMSSCLCHRPSIRGGPGKLSCERPKNGVVLGFVRFNFGGLKVRASIVDSSSSSSSPDGSSNFAKRIEQAWLISQQPNPISCTSCNSKGHVECQWCAGTGFFIIGDNMLCEIPSKNTSCVICTGEGSVRCIDCQGTGFRAKWLGRRSE